jgi:hypothetical protein
VEEVMVELTVEAAEEERARCSLQGVESEGEEE